VSILADTSLYLSRLILDPRSRRVWSELARPYEMHRTLMCAFPKAKDQTKQKAREEFGVLFRADVDEKQNRVAVYVQSLIEPDWSILGGTPGYLLADADPPKNVDSAYRRLRIGQILSFRLRANPTKRIAKAIEGNEELKGKRVGLLREEDQVAWLVRKGKEREKGKPGGFEIVLADARRPNGGITQIPRINVSPEGHQTGLKMEEKRSIEMTHLAVRFDGLLRVTDPDAFRQTLACGIGPAKALGFGLLSIAPAG
jgi:CRISPR system Cascade subunit CasE